MVKFKEGEIDYKKPLHFYVNHPCITYNLQALKKFGDRIQDRKPDVPAYNVAEAQQAIRHWLIYNAHADANGTGLKVTMGGKNFGSFDKPFLSTVFPQLEEFIKHRFVDIGNLFIKRDDIVIPDLETCRMRALEIGIEGQYINQSVTHTALEDAMLTAELYKGIYDGMLAK